MEFICQVFFSKASRIELTSQAFTYGIQHNRTPQACQSYTHHCAWLAHTVGLRRGSRYTSESATSKRPEEHRNTVIHLPSSFYIKHTISSTGRIPHQHMHSAGQPAASALGCAKDHCHHCAFCSALSSTSRVGKDLDKLGDGNGWHNPSSVAGARYQGKNCRGSWRGARVIVMVIRQYTRPAQSPRVGPKALMPPRPRVCTHRERMLQIPRTHSRSAPI